MLGAVAACLTIVGVFAQDVVAYLVIAVPVMVPLLIWLRSGARGMPVLPVLSTLYFIYYAIPLLRPGIVAYGSEELVWAAAAVGLFLLAAGAASWPFLGGQTARRDSRNVFSDTQVVPIIFVGIGGGIAYHLAVSSGSLDGLGSWLGLIRSIVLTLTSVACYLLGYARASRILTGARWAAAGTCLLILLLLALTNLLLVGAVMNALAAFLGYIITARRVPWTSLVLAFAALAVLHAGKFEVRKAYWLPHTQSLKQNSLAQIPGLMVDWVSAGVDALWSGQKNSDVFERASLLHMVLLVQRTTPDIIPYLEGETYALLPSMLVPRFLDPEKTISQAGLNLLNIRYGLQNAESAANTTIGWGLISEALANFGYLGVILVGVFFGAGCGALMRFSTGAEVNSVPMFVTIAAILTLFNLEADFAYLLTTLAQTVAAVLLPCLFLRFAAGRPVAARSVRSGRSTMREAP
jgi:hypothetical protein